MANLGRNILRTDKSKIFVCLTENPSLLLEVHTDCNTPQVAKFEFEINVIRQHNPTDPAHNPEVGMLIGWLSKQHKLYIDL
jgi:hypothetical protein